MPDRGEVSGLDDSEPPIDVVASVGALDAIVVLLREFLHRSGAVRACALLAGPAGAGPSLVDCGRLAPIEVTFSDHVVQMPHAIELDATAPAVPAVKQLPPFEVRADAGEIAAPLGGLEHYALAVRALAAALGAGNVAMVTFETTDAEVPLSITARDDEPLVLSLGEEEYEMDAAWP